MKKEGFRAFFALKNIFHCRPRRCELFEVFHEVFGSFGFETPATYSKEDIEHFLDEMGNEEKYGLVLRAKGIVPSPDGTWLHFDHVPGEIDVRNGCAAVTGRLCVIGSKIKEAEIAKLFGV